MRGAPWEPVALATKLGYVLSGPTIMMSHNDNDNTVNLTATHVLKVEVSVVNQDEIASELGKFWDYESLGIRNDSLSLYDKFVSEVEFMEGRYQVQLSFKEDHELGLCKSRLASLLKRLNLKPKVLKHYDDVIRDQEKQGIVEPVEQSTNNGVGKVHYLPHHEVIRVDKDTTKLRIVYDASARSGRNTPSLNDCLYAGPPLSPLIYDILLRFRVHKVALIADIEKAFLNVSVHLKDRDYLRFLWIDDITSGHPKLQVNRFARVAFGVSSSPFLLNATIRHHLTSADISREFAERVLKGLYVDDFVGGDDSDSSVLEMYENLKSSFKNGGFNMRKWVSNSNVLQERIEQSESQSHEVSSRFVKERPVQDEDETYSSSLFETAKNPTTSNLKVLGVGWDREKDLLLLDLTSPLETDNTCLVTKRAILGTTSKLYDPLGLLSPVVILLTIIFQSICKTRVGWDDPVDSEQWLKLVQDAKKVGVVQLKRHYFHGWSNADL